MPLKPTFLLAAFALACLPALHAAEESHGHHHHQAGPQRLQLDAGKKWQTDSPLRQALGNINQAMAEALPRIHKNRLDQEGYQALAGRVRQEIASAVDNCKLEPKADAMLHLVIADLAEGAAAMEDPASRRAGVARVVETLKSYGRYFDHPGWRAAGSGILHN